jgi:hypothetical protein
MTRDNVPEYWAQIEGRFELTGTVTADNLEAAKEYIEETGLDELIECSILADDVVITKGPMEVGPSEETSLTKDERDLVRKIVFAYKDIVRQFNNEEELQKVQELEEKLKE